MSRSNLWRWIRVLGPAVALLPAILACITRPVEKPLPKDSRQIDLYTPMYLDKDVDLLFMIDNSNSMDEEQKLLSDQFPKLIDALRSGKMGGTNCNTTTGQGCNIPNVNIGVISSDLGAGPYPNIPTCEKPGGDGGKLINVPRVKTACPTPKDAFISYRDGVTNISAAGVDPVQQVKDAFSCIAEIGVGGCGFEQQLEAVRKALDPAQNINPGFLRNTADHPDPSKREDALLAVVLITDEDDCSASNPQLFDPTNQGLTSPLGPLTSFRCFEFGVECNINDRTVTGPRTNCVPKTGANAYLHNVQSRYVDFFKSIKKGPRGDAAPHRVIVTAITGDTNRIEVGMEMGAPILKDSCKSALGGAAPSVRIKYMLDKLKDEGVHTSFTNICAGDFSPALQELGKLIVASLSAMCLKDPPLTKNSSIVCQQGDVLDNQNPSSVCKTSCLERAECVISEVSGPNERAINQCPANLFDPNIAAKDCGADCPCWRIVPHKECQGRTDSSPYAVEIMRKDEAEKGTYAKIACAASPYRWGTSELAALPQCN